MWKSFRDYSKTIISCISVFLFTACGSPDTEPELRWPDGWVPTFTTVWDDRDVLRLGSRSVELIRAVFESNRVALYYGTDYAFPGYAESLKYPGIKDVSDSAKVPPKKDRTGMPPWNATNYVTLFNFSESADRVRADICMVNKWSTDWPGWRERIPDSDVEVGITEWTRIELTRIRNSREIVKVQDVAEFQGAGVHLGQFPNWDVFAGWRISVLRFNVRKGVPQECTDWGETKIPGSKSVKSKYKGYWLEGPQVAGPLEPQYPRWVRGGNE
ncbi:MAG: hypothetical protein QM809_13630 [Gordonia sp. (in: high G+C Gram-positive bacteria)]|uniref:hypothetical protein n=1 Tax=Gordonia sp. (in: high G+C Gram-positive bacteria) TaxID=84139 RepID=UPI0039E23027